MALHRRRKSDGRAFFEDHGDELYVCDIQADGYGAVAYLQHRSGRYLLGMRDPRSSDGCYYVENSDIAENQSVRVIVCLYRDGITDYCDESSFGSTGQVTP
ncbi:hypothetical protein FHX42_001942 [Saccharopolyspora lacisalsi]|uniref:Uncharacterized protein n=1 Tax=Halosaccharopolyspora lacisalsi TaxID=1000566 RepID=A0A839DYY8_9PSEU|nr:hypothetical protein [Halosaccharopolyspora lacisalsi]MBA8824595.1 hypothetical protein [Halosaccharopolyspora lacisalsi]